MRVTRPDHDEDLTPRLRAVGLAVIYVLVGVTHSTASARIFAAIMQVTAGSRVLTLANVRAEGPLGAFFPLLPPSALAVLVSHWTWLTLAPLMATHVAFIWRRRMGPRSAYFAIVVLAVVTAAIAYSLTVELRCGQRL